MRLVSGAEPGVTEATCEFLQTKNIEMLGYCHPSCKNEAGREVASRFGLRPLGNGSVEHSFSYEDVTKQNVCMSTYVLILHLGIEEENHLLFRQTDKHSEGLHARIGRNAAFEMGIPFVSLNIQKKESPQQLRTWLMKNRPERLCVLGPSDEEAKMAGSTAVKFWKEVFGQASSVHELFSSDEARKLFDVSRKKKHFKEVETKKNPEELQNLKRDMLSSSGKPQQEVKRPELSYYKKLLVKAERQRRRSLEDG
jgi:hypothetical protein